MPWREKKPRKAIIREEEPKPKKTKKGKKKDPKQIQRMKTLEEELMATEEKKEESLEDELMATLATSKKKKKKKKDENPLSRLRNLESDLMCTADIADVHVERTDSYTPEDDMEALEAVYSCVFFPLEPSEFSREILKDKNFFKNIFPRLKKGQRDTCIKKAKAASPYVLDIVNELYEKIDSWPGYARENFATKRDYEKWRTIETTRLEKLHSSISAEPDYSGRLQLKILKLKSLQTPFEKFKSCQFEVQIGDQDPQETEVMADLDEITLQINVNEEFVFETFDPTDKLAITLNENGKVTGKIFIPLSQLSDHAPHFTWYQMHSKKGYKKISKKGKDEDDQKKKKEEKEKPEVYVYTHYTYRYTKSMCEPEKNKRKNYHNCYSHLLTRIIEANDGLLSPLEPNMTWILNEFAHRYAICEPFREMKFLHMLASAQLQKKGHFQLIATGLSRSARMMSRSSKQVLTTEDKTLYDQSVEMLKFRAKSLLSRFFMAFPTDKNNWERGALNTLILLVPELTKNQEEMNAMITKCIEDTILFSYALFKQNEEQDMEHTDAGDCAVLAHSVTGVIQALKETIQFYKAEFPEGIDITRFVAISYYNLLFQDMRELWSRDMEISVDLFKLYENLQTLHVILFHVVKEGIKIMPLKDYFGPYVTQFLIKAKSKMLEWTEKIFTRDKELNFPTLAKDKGILHSPSAVDLFEQFNQSLKWLAKFKLFDLTPQKIAFSGIVSEVIDLYLKCLYENMLERMDQVFNTEETGEVLVQKITQHYEFTEKKRAELEKENEEREKAGLQPLEDGENGLDSLTTNTTLCVMANSVFSVQKQYQDFIEDLTDITESSKEGEVVVRPELEEVFTTQKKDIKQEYTHTVNMISASLIKWLRAALGHLVASPIDVSSEQEVEARLAPTIHLLNMELSTLRENLYDGIFDDVLLQVWRGWKEGVVDILSPPTITFDSQKRDYQAQIIGAVLTEIVDFFHADGEGISRSYLEKSSHIIETTVKYYTFSTSKLLQVYENLTEGKKALAPKIQIAIDSDSDDDSDDEIPKKKKKKGKQEDSEDESDDEEEEDSDDEEEEEEEEEPGEHEVLCILATRSESAAKKLVSQKISKMKDLSIRRKFHLSLDEDVVESITCVGPDRHRGTLYLTTKQLCFDALLPILSRYNLHFSISIIKEVERGEDSSLVVQTVRNRKYIFSKLSSLEHWYGIVHKQGMAVGASFVVVQDDKQKKTEEYLAHATRKKTGIFTPVQEPPQYSKNPNSRKKSFVADSKELDAFIAAQEVYIKEFEDAEMDPLISFFTAIYKKKSGALYISKNHVSFVSSAVFGKKFRVPIAHLKSADMRQLTLTKTILALKISAREEYQFEFKNDVDKACGLISDLIKARGK